LDITHRQTGFGTHPFNDNGIRTNHGSKVALIIHSLQTSIRIIHTSMCITIADSICNHAKQLAIGTQTRHVQLDNHQTSNKNAVMIDGSI
jgi:hypothetical protein